MKKHTSRMPVRVALAHAAALVVGSAGMSFGGLTAPLGAAMTWLGGTGQDWIEGVWTTGGFHPFGPGSSATINNDHVSLVGLNINVDHLTLTGATLSGINPGTLTANLSMTLNAGSSGNIWQLGGLRNLGTATWVSGAITTNSGVTTFSNLGTFDIQSDQTLQPFFFPVATILNTGLINKTAGTGQSTLFAEIQNSGTIRADTGTLLLTNSGLGTLGHSGTFISNTGSLRFVNQLFTTGTNFRGAGVSYLDGGNAIGAGNSIATGGTLRVIGAGNNFGGTITIASGGTLDLASGGEMTGNGRIQGTGLFTWTGGTISGDLSENGDQLENFAPMRITGTDPKALNNGRFTNAATCVWDNGDITTNNSPVFTNSGTMDLQSDNSLNFFFFGPATLKNTGLWKKTAGTGTSLINIDLQNTGTVLADSGTLRFSGLSGASSSSGTFISNAGVVQLANQFLQTGANFRGSGTSELDGGNTVVGNVSVAAGGALRVVGFANTISGSLNIASTGVFNLSTGGELNGNGSINGPGEFRWTGGTVFGATGAGVDSLTSTGPMLITGPDGKFLNNGRFTNAGSAIWDNGNITTNNANIFTNSGTMDLQSDNNLNFFFFGPATLVNTGTWKKTAGTGTSLINIDLQNTGTVLASSGILRLNGLSTAASSSGTFISNGVGVVQLGSQTLTNGANFRGSGTSELDGGNVIPQTLVVASAGALRVVGVANELSGTIAISAGATLNLATGGGLNGNGRINGPGIFAWTGGALRGPDTPGVDSLSIAAPTQIDGPDGKSINNGRVTNLATMVWNDGNITTNSAPTLTNAGTFDIRSNNTLAAFFFPALQFDNNGLFIKSAGGGLSNISAIFNNAGRVQIDSGSVAFSQDFVTTGTFVVSAGAGVVFNGGSTTIGGQQFWPVGYVLPASPSTTAFNSDAGANGANLTIEHGAGILLLNSTQHLAGLSHVHGQLIVTPAGNTVISTRSLTVGGVFPSFDLTNNNMVADYTGASPFSEIRTQIINGYAAGSWDGFGIVSATAATTPGTGIGYAEASDLFTAFPASFAGEMVDSTSVLVRYTLLGDTNLDRVVDIADFSRLGANFNSSATWAGGDFNYDGAVGIGDFAFLAANFNQSLAASLPRASAVPEPTLGATLVLGAAMFAKRRPRRLFRSDCC